MTSFRKLRARHEIATRMAALEAEAYGTVFRLKETTRGYELENKAYESWKSAPPLDQSDAQPSTAGESAETITGPTKGRETLEGTHPGQRRPPQAFSAGENYLTDDLSGLDGLKTTVPENVVQQKDLGNQVLDDLTSGTPSEAAAALRLLGDARRS